MENNNVKILDVHSKDQFYKWMIKNAGSETECYLVLKRGKPIESNVFYYLDAVEVALCFGWIDSTLGLINGIRVQKFTPRAKSSPWTELNKERVRRLEKLGLMTDAGRKVLPDMNIDNFTIDEEYIKVLQDNGAYDNFLKFPALYQRIRIYNLRFHKTHSKNEYPKMLDNFIKNTKANKLYGEWNDYGRLLDY